MKLCSQCGNKFKPTNRQNKNLYCSLKCYGLAHKGIEARSLNKWRLAGGKPANTKPPAVKECSVCGVEFSGEPNEIKKRKYCSTVCFYRANSGENNSRWNRIENKCIVCGKEWSSTPADSGKYCSPGCYNSFAVGENHPNYGRARLDMRGANNPFWKGGIAKEDDKIRRSVKYKVWRKKVFERDNYTCRGCGARSKSGATVYIQAHHIKAFAKHKELRFDVDNGETLCLNCHTKTRTYLHQEIPAPLLEGGRSIT